MAPVLPQVMEMGARLQGQRRFGVPTLLVGDLNILPDGLERALLGLFVPGLVDCWRTAHPARLAGPAPRLRAAPGRRRCVIRRCGSAQPAGQAPRRQRRAKSSFHLPFVDPNLLSSLFNCMHVAAFRLWDEPPVRRPISQSCLAVV